MRFLQGDLAGRNEWPGLERSGPGLPGAARQSEAGGSEMAVHVDVQVVSSRTSTQPTLPSEIKMADTVVRTGLP